MKVAAKRIGISFGEYQDKLRADLKWCSKGKHFILKNKFGKNRLKYDGLEPNCLECTHVKERVDTKGKLAWNKGIPATLETRQKMSDAHQGSRNHQWKGGKRKMKTTHVALIARRQVNHAIEAERLPRPDTLTCIQCGKPAREYHHHLGYAPEHWLDVVPVCSACNKVL